MFYPHQGLPPLGQNLLVHFPRPLLPSPRHRHHQQDLQVPLPGLVYLDVFGVGEKRYLERSGEVSLVLFDGCFENVLRLVSINSGCWRFWRSFWNWNSCYGHKVPHGWFTGSMTSPTCSAKDVDQLSYDPGFSSNNPSLECRLLYAWFLIFTFQSGY